MLSIAFTSTRLLVQPMLVQPMAELDEPTMGQPKLVRPMGALDGLGGLERPMGLQGECVLLSRWPLGG